MRGNVWVSCLKSSTCFLPCSGSYNAGKTSGEIKCYGSGNRIGAVVDRLIDESALLEVVRSLGLEMDFLVRIYVKIVHLLSFKKSK